MDDPELDRRLHEAGEQFRSQHEAAYRPPDLTAFAGAPRRIRWGTLAPVGAVAAVAAMIIGVFWVGTIFEGRQGRVGEAGAAEQGGSTWDPDLPKGVGPVEVPGAIPPVNEAMNWPGVEMANSFRPRTDIASGHPYCLLRQLDLAAEVVDGSFAFAARLKPGEEACRMSGYAYFEWSLSGRHIEVLGGATDPVIGQWPADPLITARRGALVKASLEDWCVVAPNVDTAIFFDHKNGVAKVSDFPDVDCPQQASGEVAELTLPTTYWQPEGWLAEPVRGDFSGLEVRLVDTATKDYPGTNWDGTPTWVVELTATDHDIELDPCPGYQVALGTMSEEEVATRRLNCQAVQRTHADGKPYLRKGEPVRFAIWGNGPTDAPQTLRMFLPGERRELALTEGAAAPTGEPRMVGEAEANLHLYISNQSFDDPDAPVRLTIDGVVIVDQVFAVEGQHNWVPFEVAIAAGTHQIEITGANGAKESAIVDVPAHGDLWAVADYWVNDGKGSFDWRVSDHSIGFK